MLWRRTAAFRIVELLMVVTLISVLVSLLRPAVSAAREAARRRVCVSHLGQIVLALQQYELTHAVYPAGTMEDKGPILNWTARGVLIGGIYARPLALGNFLHFAMVGVMLAKAAIMHGVVQLATSAFVFSGFAIWFGIVLFTSPVKALQAED